MRTLSGGELLASKAAAAAATAAGGTLTRTLQHFYFDDITAQMQDVCKNISRVAHPSLLVLLHQISDVEAMCAHSFTSVDL